MDEHKAALNAFEHRISAQMDEAKAHISGIEAAAKGKAAGAEIDALKNLHTMKANIEAKRAELKTAHEAKASALKGEIEAEVAKLKTSAEAMHSKVKPAVKSK